MTSKIKLLPLVLVVLGLASTTFGNIPDARTPQISLISLQTTEEEPYSSKFDDDYWTDYCVSSSWTQSPVQLSSPLHYLGTLLPFLSF